jgi:hypothetical protein
MMLLSMSSKSTIEHCLSLKDCLDGRKTLFICSYPKSGTTWMQAIVYNLLSNGNQHFSHISEYSPFFEVDKNWDFSEGNTIDGKIKLQHEMKFQQLGWRVFNTHLRWEMMPKQPNMRYIYVVRNGKDVALSFFQHLSNQNDADCFDGTLLDFLSKWCNAQLPYGNWLHHLQSWAAVYKSNASKHGSETPEVLFVRYQDMVANPLQCVNRIVDYLGLHASITDQRAEELLEYVSFSYMKQHQEQYMPISVPWKEGYSFIRNGKVGDNANYFTAEHDALYDAMVQRVFMDQGAKIPDWLLELEVL